MKFSSWLPLAMTLAGTASLRLLARRHEAEKRHNQVSICIDLDDAQAVAIRSGLSLEVLFQLMAQQGATHVSLPEWTLERLLRRGRLTPQAPAQLRLDPAPVGHWNYLAGDADLVEQLAAELNQRLPQTAAAVMGGGNTLVFAGDLPSLGEIGLGFDTTLAGQMRRCGLQVVPRPVSFAWPLPALLQRSLAQAAQIGRYVAFAGEMILGHEMHLDATVAALEEHDLRFVYFAESRHQKGDWFVAKRRAPKLVLGHRFTPAEMVPLDYHAACHNWVHFARERGIRFCYVNFFKVLHATEPLEGLEYIAHLRQALLDAGFAVSPEPVELQMPTPDAAELAMAGLTTAGIAASAVSEWLDLPSRWALPLTAAAAAGAISLPFLEKTRNQAAASRPSHGHHHPHHHEALYELIHDDHGAPDPIHGVSHDHGVGHEHDLEHDHGDLQALYPPSYAPKLLSLGLTALTPVANMTCLERRGVDGWWQGVIYQVAAAGTLALLTSGQEYQLRIEEYRGFNLDWLLPLAAVTWRFPRTTARFGGLALLTGGWLLARRQNVDLLTRLDPGHAEGHTHHISAAMALVGDAGMAVGPRPARKWSGMGPAAYGASWLLAKQGRPVMALAASGLGVVGNILGLAGFRRPERALTETLQTAGPSLAAGSGLGLLLLLAAWLMGDDD